LEEFENGQTPEAIAELWMNWNHYFKIFQIKGELGEFGVDYSRVYERKVMKERFCGNLELCKSLINESVEKGILKK
jgi:hypothetical protein